MMHDLFEYKPVSLGEAILILLAVGIPLSGVIYNYLRRRTFAFAMTVSAHAMQHGTPAEVRLTVKARAPAILERFNVRLVERRWLGLALRNATKGRDWRLGRDI